MLKGRRADASRAAGRIAAAAGAAARQVHARPRRALCDAGAIISTTIEQAATDSLCAGYAGRATEPRGPSALFARARCHRARMTFPHTVPLETVNLYFLELAWIVMGVR